MLSIDRDRSALLVMDLQADIVGMLGDKGPPLVEHAARVVAAARQAKVPVIYVVVAFRAGYPELGSRSPATFAQVAKSGRFLVGAPGTEVVAAVRPAPEEPVVVKHRVGAFSGTDLAVILRAHGIETLVLLGISTSGVVLSTLRHAADHDYKVVVVKDACADPDDEVHRVLTEKVFVRQATIASVAEVIAALAT